MLNGGCLNIEHPQKTIAPIPKLFHKYVKRDSLLTLKERTVVDWPVEGAPRITIEVSTESTSNRN